MKIKYLIISLLAVILIGACTKNAQKNSLVNMSSTDLYQKGWQYYSENDFANAEEYFTELTTRPNDKLEGYLGLGWTYLRENKILNAQNELNKFFNEDSLDTILPTDSSYADGKAGQCFVYSCLNDHTNVISTSTNLTGSWKFRFDEELNYRDIVLLKAISYFALAQYSQSLEMVKILDPSFEVDLTFNEGKILLAQKIEDLKNTI